MIVVIKAAHRPVVYRIDNEALNKSSKALTAENNRGQTTVYAKPEMF